jgi:glycosyltransferase involved in cell wall biosynthesis
LYLLLRAGRYDIIHCHATDLIGFIVALVGKITGKPVILKLSTNGEFQYGFGYGKVRAAWLGAAFERIRTCVMRFTATNAHIVALNREGLDELRRVGAKRPVVLPNGVDRTVYFPATELDRLRLREKFSFGRADVIFLFTGRFVHRKGIDLLLTAFRSFLERRGFEETGLWLCLVGSGDMQEDPVHEQIDSIVSSCSDHIKVLPPIGSIADYLQIADAFVFPSRKEGMPNSVLEALAAGLPCILSDIEPHREIAEHDPSAPIHFFASGDSRSLESQLVQAATRLHEERKRGTRLIARLNERYDIDTVSGRYVDIYRQALGLI